MSTSSSGHGPSMSCHARALDSSSACCTPCMDCLTVRSRSPAACTSRLSILAMRNACSASSISRCARFASSARSSTSACTHASEAPDGVAARASLSARASRARSRARSRGGWSGRGLGRAWRWQVRSRRPPAGRLAGRGPRATRGRRGSPAPGRAMIPAAGPGAEGGCRCARARRRARGASPPPWRWRPCRNTARCQCRYCARCH
mmetsp:Transcript_1597/g.3969  ORF Transcript_1597/g.3969 Transcript_1597/m.3969 type:complete len:205 (-) Transcript_1597:8-622(-)